MGCTSSASSVSRHSQTSPIARTCTSHTAIYTYRTKPPGLREKGTTPSGKVQASPIVSGYFQLTAAGEPRRPSHRPIDTHTSKSVQI